MVRQKTIGPRWFVPLAWRRNPNAYNYYRDVPSAIIKRAKREAEANQKLGNQNAPMNQDDEAIEEESEEMLCVICMNGVHLQVDESGSLVHDNTVNNNR